MDTPVTRMLERKGHDVISVDRAETVYAAIATMEERKVGAVLVTEDEGSLCGIFTERDYLRRIILQGHEARTTPLGSVMTAAVLTVAPDTTVRECLSIMTIKRCRHLPVLGSDAVVGVVSIGDCVRQLVADQDYEIRVLTDYITSKYPA